MNVAAERLIVSGGLLVAFYHVDPGDGAETDVAMVSAVINVFCQPAMVTTTNDALQVQFQRAEVVEDSTSIEIIDETGILGGYASIADFKENASRYLEQVTSRTGTLGFALPAYLESRPMPDYWHHVNNIVLDSQHFAYRTINVHGFEVGYLFIVFSMRSLGLPVPCYCESESASTSLEEANMRVAAIEVPQRQERPPQFAGATRCS